MGRVSSAAFVSRACREDRTKRSTAGAVSGWVESFHPPATLRRTIPEPRSPYSVPSDSSSASTVLLSASRICASAPDDMGSSVTNSTASSARPTSLRSLIAPPPLDLDLRPFSSSRLLPPHLDLPERLSLRELDLPLTVKLEQGQEPDHHADAILAVRDEVAEPSRPSLTETALDVADGVGHRRPDRSGVREVHARRRAQEGSRGLRDHLRCHSLHEVRIQVGELLRGGRLPGVVQGAHLGHPRELRQYSTKRRELEAPGVGQIRRPRQEILVPQLVGLGHEPADLQL